MAKNYLLIISCSDRKVETPGPIPAIERYDGPTYRILRKMQREETFPADTVDILIISAQYGLIPAQTKIEDYDQRMTPERAAKLAISIQYHLTREIIDGDDSGIDDTRFYIYDEVFINLGKTYRQTLEGFHWGLIRTYEASGGIGLKNQQMKAWLERIYGV